MASEKIVVMLPGQAAQEAGMGEEAFDTYDEVKEVFYTASTIAGEDLAEYCWGSKTDELKGAIVQPALGAAILADLAVKKKNGLVPSLYMGHSVSEIIALSAAGAFPDLNDTFRILTVRGLAMDDANLKNPGVMTAFLGPNRENFDWALNLVNRRLSRIGESAIYHGMANWTEQHVASGNVAGIQVMENVFDVIHRVGGVARARARLIKDDGAAHTPHMESAVERVYEEIRRAKKREPDVPVLANDGRYLDDPSRYAYYLSHQLIMPADWQLSMWVAVEEGYRDFVEVGTKKELMTTFAKREFKEHRIVREKFGDVVHIVRVSEASPSIREQLKLLAARQITSLQTG
jgi:[acyl-carrier-protein] S-malonyltransferase